MSGLGVTHARLDNAPNPAAAPFKKARPRIISCPSPFITETATRVFRTVEEALAFFEARGMFGQKNLFGH